MLLSVIIPVYNSATYLAECVESVFAQLPKDAEVICVDDGSTDSSLSILLEFAGRDARIKVVHQENKGQGAARNQGLLHARGDYIYFIDSDDALTEDYPFEQLIQEMKQNNLDILFFDAKAQFDTPALCKSSEINANYYVRRHKYLGIYSGKDLFAEFISNREFAVPPYLMMLSRSFIVKNDLRFPEGCYYEDNVFIQHSILKEKRVSHRPWLFYLRKVHKESTVTRTPTLRHLRGRIICYQDILDFLRKKEWYPKVRKGLRERLVVHKHYLRRFVRENPELIIQCQSQLTADEWACIAYIQSYPIRDKVMDTFQCLKDRGFFYTIKRIFVRLHSRT